MLNNKIYREHPKDDSNNSIDTHIKVRKYYINHNISKVKKAWYGNDMIVF